MVAAGSPAVEFEQKKDQVIDLVQSEMRRNLQNEMSVNAEIGVAGFDATAFGLFATVSADFGNVSILEGSVTPEIILSLNQWITSS